MVFHHQRHTAETMPWATASMDVERGGDHIWRRLEHVPPELTR
jgi:hypothetical protein